MLSEALRKVVPVLEGLEIPYALIGGLALGVHNVIRATEDVDLLVQRSPAEMQELAREFRAKGMRAVSRKGAADDPLIGVVVLEVPIRDGKVTCDLILPSSGWQFEAIRESEVVNFEGLSLRVARRKDLFLLKLFAASPQDLLDAADLLRQQAPNGRRAWKARAAQLRLSAEYARCLKFMK
ncbi:MAG: nucleotidyl transferase AbiEii/AbiGii toxin family protein [Acidobacteriia bacterium]|nr:nucleotidyl transferase AbiEii/AbiGii toxin family protein [Terriglobia bacterium]